MSRERVLECMEQLGADELEVLAEVASGLVMGRSVYGALRVNGDARDWQREAFEEARDGLVYVAAALIKAKRARPPVPRPIVQVRPLELWTCKHGTGDRPCAVCFNARDQL